MFPIEIPTTNTQISGGDSFNLLTILIRAQQAADDSHTYGEVAEAEFLTAFFSEARETQMQLVRRTQATIDQLKQHLERGK